MHAQENSHLATILAQNYFLPRNLSIYRVAKDTGIQGKLLCGILTGRQRLSVRETLLLDRYFNEEDGFFAKIQLDYEVRNERQRLTSASPVS